MPPHLFHIEVTGDSDEGGVGGDTQAHHLLVSLTNGIRLIFGHHVTNPRQKFDSNVSYDDVTTALGSGRFFFYSRRVKHFVRSLPQEQHRHSIQRNVDDTVTSAWQTPSAALFPLLRHLHIQIPGTEDSSMLGFLSPSITSLFVELPPNLDNLGEFLLPHNWSQQSKGLVSFKLNFVGCHPDVFRTITTATLSRASQLETVEASGTLAQDTLLRLASYPRLRKLTVGGNLDGRRSELPRGCFPSVESADLTDSGDRLDFVHGFLARASDVLLRHLTIRRPSYSKTSLSRFIEIIKMTSHFTNLTRVSFRVQITDTSSILKQEQMDIVHQILEPLTSLAHLKELSIHTDQMMTLPEPGHTMIFASWPWLEVCAVTNTISVSQSKTKYGKLSLSLSAFFDILSTCPRLTWFSGLIDCTAMPSEESIARLEQLRHPFRSHRGELRWSGLPEHSIEQVIHRAVPHLRLRRFTFVSN
jgi:hypothetical protein